MSTTLDSHYQGLIAYDLCIYKRQRPDRLDRFWMEDTCSFFPFYTVFARKVPKAQTDELICVGSQAHLYK